MPHCSYPHRSKTLALIWLGALLSISCGLLESNEDGAASSDAPEAAENELGGDQEMAASSGGSDSSTPKEIKEEDRIGFDDLEPPEGKIIWAGYNSVEAGLVRSYVADLSYLSAVTLHPITEPGFLAVRPVFSPGGSKLAFGIVDERAVVTLLTDGVTGGTPAKVSLWIVDANEGFEARRLDISETIPWVREFAWLGNNRMWLSSSTLYDAEAYILDLQSNELTKLDAAVKGKKYTNAWSLKHGLVYSIGACTQAYIGVEEEKGTRLPSYGLCEGEGDFILKPSADGSFFARVWPGKAEVYAAHADGFHSIELVQPGATGASSEASDEATSTRLEWSPKGALFAAVQYKGEGSESLLLGNAEAEISRVFSTLEPVSLARYVNPDLVVLDNYSSALSWMASVNLEEEEPDAKGNLGELQRLNPNPGYQSWYFYRSVSDDGISLYYSAEGEDGLAVYHLSLDASLESDGAAQGNQVSSPLGESVRFSYLEAILDETLLFYSTSEPPIEGAAAIAKSYLMHLDGSGSTVPLSPHPRYPALERVALHRPKGLPYVIHHARDAEKNVVIALPIDHPEQALHLFDFPRIAGSTTLSFPPQWPEAL